MAGNTKKNLPGFSEYTSDPAHPVPYTEGVHDHRTREYMTDDQRFASRRPDVLSFQTDTLTEDMTLAGPVIAELITSISSTDADFVVKLIDIFPDDFQYDDSIKGMDNNYPMGGYEMLVRGEIMRGKYRNINSLHLKQKIIFFYKLNKINKVFFIYIKDNFFLLLFI